MKYSNSILAAGIFAAAMSTSSAHASDWSAVSCDSNWGPKESVTPAYPRRAQERGVEGYIVMSYSVAEDGSVVDVAVKEAAPARAFVRAATKAVTSMEFIPCVANGRAVKVTDLSIKYDFALKG